MNDLAWTFRSLYKNLLKGKFKALFRLFWDSKYRQDVFYMKSVCKRYYRFECECQIGLESITFGHDLNYPNWVKKLKSKIDIDGPDSLEPIKVVWDETKSKYLVVDGNHRLMALLSTVSKYRKIKVILLEKSL